MVFSCVTSSIIDTTRRIGGVGVSEKGRAWENEAATFLDSCLDLTWRNKRTTKPGRESMTALVQNGAMQRSRVQWPVGILTVRHGGRNLAPSHQQRRAVVSVLGLHP